MTTRRATRVHAERRTYFVPVEPGDTFARVCEAAPADVDRVFMVGGLPDVVSWVAEGLPAGWELHGRSAVYVAGEAATIRCVRPDGRPVELVSSSSWFGTFGVADCATGWVELVDELGELFPDGQPLTSPSATGRTLFATTIPWGHEYPVLTTEVQELIRATMGQGRTELVVPAGTTVPELHAVDGRFMYAALCWGLPSGSMVRDSADEYAGQVRGRYLVTWTAPRGWEHVGILPANDGHGWTWPLSGTGWVDGAELHLALKFGWRVRVHERMLWPTPGKPLDTWADKLRELRRRVTTPAARYAVRAILLHALGGFVGAPHRTTHVGEPHEVPDTARDVHRRGGRMVWTVEHGQGWPEMAHPEWAAAIYGRARARLLSGPKVNGTPTGALHLPAGQVVGFRTDAIYTTSPVAWPDDGADGRFRPAGASTGPVMLRTTLDMTKGVDHP